MGKTVHAAAAVVTMALLVEHCKNEICQERCIVFYVPIPNTASLVDTAEKLSNILESY